MRNSYKILDFSYNIGVWYSYSCGESGDSSVSPYESRGYFFTLFWVMDVERDNMKWPRNCSSVDLPVWYKLNKTISGNRDYRIQ